jgi:threonine/homoserine/homoserine lactone efflux protein
VRLRDVAGIPMMIVGLGTVLLLASPVRAQQEIDPDTFDINPGTAVAEEAKAPAEAPAAMSTAHVENATPQQAVVYAALFTPGVTQQEKPLSHPTAVDMTMGVILMVGTAMIAFYVVAATRRTHRLQSSLNRSAYSPASGATTH